MARHTPTRTPTPVTQEALWRQYDAVEVRLTAPLSERMLDLAQVEPGMRILDLATGRGEPALRAARRVAPGGFVLGVDAAPELLQIAKERADHEGITNLALRAARAEQLDDIAESSFDVVTSRWGLGYMASPVRALSNARRALVRDGRLVAAFWAEPERVPYASMPRRLLAVDRPLPAPDPEAPGTFRYARLEWIVRDLERAGFELEDVEEVDIPVFESESVAEVVTWLMALGVAQLLESRSTQEQAAWRTSIDRELERTRTDGVIRLGGVTRIVRARVARSAGKRPGSSMDTVKEWRANGGSDDPDPRE